MPLGDSYFKKVPESTSSKRVECVIYKGPSQTLIRNQDAMKMAVLKILAALNKHEQRLTAGNL